MEGNRTTVLAYKKTRFFVFGLVFVLSIFGIICLNKAFAATPPTTITYQGKILVNNLPVTTTLPMQFDLYNDPTAGSLLYSTTTSVVPSNGLFSVGLTGIDPTIFKDNSLVYLKITVNPGSSPEVLSPRKQITSAPYAFNAQYLAGVGTATNSSSTYIPVSDASGNFNFNGVTSSLLRVTGNASLVTTTVNGWLSVGTSTAPQYALDVNGNINLSNSLYLGSSKLLSITNGLGSVAVGVGSGHGSVGIGNSFFGASAGASNSSGDWNIFLGASAGAGNLTGSANLFLGAEAGLFHTEGNGNIFSGFHSGYFNTSGLFNTFLGTSAGFGNNGSYNVFLGNGAGSSETGSNRLYISNSNTTTPLIYGEFDNSLLRVNGQLDVTGTSTQIGFRLGTTSTNGYVLTTDANGYGTWQVASGGGLSGGLAGTLSYWTSGNSLSTTSLFWDNVNGRLGVGTSTATSTLNVAGDIYYTGVLRKNGGKFLSSASGFGDLVIGLNAGHDTSGGVNTFVGNSSGAYNSTGNENTFLGASSGLLNTFGGLNTFIGRYAGESNETGSQNVYVGANSGIYSTGTGNVFLGYGSGSYEVGSNKFYVANSNTASPLIYGEFDNSLLRVNGQLNVTQTSTLAATTMTAFRLGSSASSGYVLTTDANGYGTWQVASGGGVSGGLAGTLPYWTGGNSLSTTSLFWDNVNGRLGVGTTTPASSLDVVGDINFSGNLYKGTSKLLSFTAGGGGLAIGVGAGHNATGAGIYLGENAGNSNPTAYNNMFIGSSAGANTISGGKNIFIGNTSGGANTSGSDNVYVGQWVNTVGNGSYNVFLGSEAGYANTGSGNILIGYKAGYNATSSNRLYIANSNTTSPLIYGEFDNNLVRINGNFDVTGTSTFSTTTASKLTVSNLPSGSVVFAGEGGLLSSSSSLYWDNVNGRLGVGTTTPTSSLDVVGDIAMNGVRVLSSSVVLNNIFLGANTGLLNTSGNWNTLLGVNAGSVNSSGYNNTFVGASAGSSNDNINNTFVGASAGSSNVGLRNTFIGSSAGSGNIGGLENVILGSRSGESSSGNRNTYLGTLSGFAAGGSDNVFVGYSAGSSESGSHKLYISNSNTSSPLIYGEFDNQLLRVNGNQEITGNLFVTGTSQIVGTSTLGIINAGTWQGTAIANNYGGTGQNSSAWTGLVRVNAGTWATSTVNLASALDVSGILGYTNGGTGTSTIGGVGSMIYSNGSTYAFTNTPSTGYIMQYSGSVPTWVTTSSLGFGTVTGNGTSGQLAFWTGDSALSSSSTLYWDNINGYLGIGTSTLSHNLTVVGSGSFSDHLDITGITNTSTIAGAFDVGSGGLTYDYTGDLVSIPNLELGALSFSDDAGQVSWVDMGVTASSSVGTVLSYSAQMAGNPLLTVFGVSDGNGAVATSGVAINTTTVSAYKLYVDSGSDTGAGIGVNGYIKATSFITGTTTLDLAETYPIDKACKQRGDCPVPGDLVCLANSTSTNGIIEKCSVTNSNKIIGIISTNPGMVLGAFDPSDADSSKESYRAVALSGRVPTKVSLDNGPILPGDLLTVSTEPGVAVKAIEPGFVVGMALSGFNSSSNFMDASSTTSTVGSIQVFVSPQWTIGSLDLQKDISDNNFVNENNSWLEKFTAAIQYALNKLGLFIKSGVATLKSVITDDITTKNIKTNILCVGDTCVSESELKDLLQRNQTAPVIMTHDADSTIQTTSTTSTTQNTDITSTTITTTTTQNSDNTTQTTTTTNNDQTTTTTTQNSDNTTQTATNNTQPATDNTVVSSTL